MIVRGSMKHSFSGRRRKTFRAIRRQKSEFVPLDKAVVPNQRYLEWQEEQRKYKSAGFVADPTMGRVSDDSFRKEVSSNYTVSIAFNKGAYQVIPNKDIKHIGK